MSFVPRQVERLTFAVSLVVARLRVFQAAVRSRRVVAPRLHLILAVIVVAVPPLSARGALQHVLDLLKVDVGGRDRLLLGSAGARRRRVRVQPAVVRFHFLQLRVGDRLLNRCNKYQPSQMDPRDNLSGEIL